MTLTPVSAHIKSAMLNYPSIYPTRLKVLEHNFVGLGNGIVWTSDGVLAERYSEREMKNEIRLEDLDERLKWWEGRLEEYNNREDGSPSNYETQKYYRDGIAKVTAERQARIARQNNIDVLASEVDPNGELTGYYGNLPAILADLFTKNYTGLPYMNLWNIPKNVEKSWWDASCEVVQAAIRTSNSPDDRNYMRLCWKAMSDFVEGRAEKFVVPARPETHRERIIRLDAVADARRVAYDQVKEIERVINRAGYALDMKSKQRCLEYRTNGTYSMGDYEPRILTAATIAKIDKAMVKRGYVRTDDAMRPTWENGLEHRVALRLIPYVFDELYIARVLIIGYPEDEKSNDTKKRGYFEAGQRAFDAAKLGMYKEPEPEQPTVPASERNIYQVVPGSLTVEGSIVTAGVHTGPTEWQVENIRYVRADLSSVADRNRTLVDILSETYDNTVGCLVQGGFKSKG